MGPLPSADASRRGPIAAGSVRRGHSSRPTGRGRARNNGCSCIISGRWAFPSAVSCAPAGRALGRARTDRGSDDEDDGSADEEGGGRRWIWSRRRSFEAESRLWEREQDLDARRGLWGGAGLEVSGRSEGGGGWASGCFWLYRAAAAGPVIQDRSGRRRGALLEAGAAVLGLGGSEEATQAVVQARGSDAKHQEQRGQPAAHVKHGPHPSTLPLRPKKLNQGASLTPGRPKKPFHCRRWGRSPAPPPASRRRRSC